MTIELLFKDKNIIRLKSIDEYLRFYKDKQHADYKI